MGQRDKRNIDGKKVDWLRQLRRCDAADIRSLPVYYTGILPQGFRQLTVPHVHRIDTPCPVLEHTVCETAGGCANVHTDQAIQLQSGCLHCMFQLQTATSHEGQIFPLHGHLVALRHSIRRLGTDDTVDENLSVSDESLRTLPAGCHAMFGEPDIKSRHRPVPPDRSAGCAGK